MGAVAKVVWVPKETETYITNMSGNAVYNIANDTACHAFI